MMAVSGGGDWGQGEIIFGFLKENLINGLFNDHPMPGVGSSKTP